MLGEMTDADKIMYPQHFGTDPNPTDIGIQVNPGLIRQSRLQSRMTFG